MFGLESFINDVFVLLAPPRATNDPQVAEYSLLVVPFGEPPARVTARGPVPRQRLAPGQVEVTGLRVVRRQRARWLPLVLQARWRFEVTEVAPARDRSGLLTH